MKIASLTLLLGAAARLGNAKRQDDLAAKGTYFDGIEVPPLLELTSNNIETEFRRTEYMVVKYGSPWCKHCQVFAPTYQTLYEYYYTSDLPASLGRPSNRIATTFEEYYGIRFSTVDCAAYFEVCQKYDINSYPQTILYKNGEAVGSVRGSKNMTFVSNLIENALEAEFPGTRPRDPLLPTPGSNSRPVPEDKVKSKLPTDESQKPLVADKVA